MSESPATVAFAPHVYDELVSWLDLEVEAAGILLMRSGEAGGVLLARELVPVPDAAYLERTPFRLGIASSGYVPTLKRAAADGAIACFVHSHPGGAPHHSELDDVVDDEFRRLFPDRTGQAIYPSLIVGGRRDAPRFRARVFHVDGSTSSVRKFRATGRRLRVFVEEAAEASSAVFDRQVRAFGVEGQTVLRQLRVGVVGAGGTGSAVIEQLARLGVGELVIADDDAVTDTNLTRIHESSILDVDAPKVAVAGRLGAKLPHPAATTEIVGRVTDAAVACAFAGCDVIFGCTDDDAGRAVLSRLAYWYLIPVIDMGVVIDSVEGDVQGIYGRVTTIGPGSACLVCRGVVDPIRMRNDLLSPEEREARVAEGYAPELAEPDPSVVAYTTLVASIAVAELLSRLFGIGDPVDHQLLAVHDRRIRAIAGAPRDGHYCIDPRRWALGDEEPFLGQTW